MKHTKKSTPRRCNNCPIVNTNSPYIKEQVSSHAHTNPRHLKTNRETRAQNSVETGN